MLNGQEAVTPEGLDKVVQCHCLSEVPAPIPVFQYSFCKSINSIDPVSPGGSMGELHITDTTAEGCRQGCGQHSEEQAMLS